MLTLLYAKYLDETFLLSEYGMIGKFIIEAKDKLNLRLNINRTNQLIFIEVLPKNNKNLDAEPLALIIPRYNHKQQIEVNISSDNDLFSKKKMDTLLNALTVAQDYRKTEFLRGNSHYANIPAQAPEAITPKQKAQEQQKLNEFIQEKLGVPLSETLMTLINAN